MSTDKEPSEDSGLVVPKDEGWAWMVLLGSFFVQFIVIGGGIRTFGIFAVDIQDKYDVTSWSICWLYATLACLLSLNAMVATILVSVFDTRRVVICGGLISTLGFILSANATSVASLYFSYGFLVGVGGSLAYSPSIVAVGQHFVKKRAFAVGVCFAGSGVGAFVLPPLVSLALQRYGLNGAFLLMAGMSFNICVFGMLFRPPSFYLKRHIQKGSVGNNATSKGGEQNECVSISVINVEFPKIEHDIPASKISSNGNVLPDKCHQSIRIEKKSDIDWKLFRNPLLYLYVVSLSMANGGFYNIFNILPSHMNQLGVSKADAAWLVSILGVADLLSRLSTGAFADLNLFRKRHIFQFSMLASGLTFCIAPFLTSYSLLAADCIVMSFAGGSFVTLAPVLLAEGLGAENLSTAFGFANVCDALPHLLAPALLSFVRETTGSWNVSFVMCGMSLVMAAILNAIGPFCCATARKQLQMSDNNVAFARDTRRVAPIRRQGDPHVKQRTA